MKEVVNEQRDQKQETYDGQGGSEVKFVIFFSSVDSVNYGLMSLFDNRVSPSKVVRSGSKLN